MRIAIRVAAMFLVMAGIAEVAAFGLDGSGDFVRPREGQELTYRHVRFWWPQPDGLPAFGWTLIVVEDDGSSDPFAAPPTAPLVVELPEGEPRAVIDSGLAFGTDYAWRADARTSYGTVPGDVHRFSISPIPPHGPELTLLRNVPDRVQPGVTLFSASTREPGSPQPAGFLFGVDGDGEIIWFRHRPDTGANTSNVRQYEDGRISFIGPRSDAEPGSSGRSAIEETLDGRVVWESPDVPNLVVHHDHGRLPDGSPLVLVFETYRLPEDGFEPRRGDRVLVLDRHTGESTWEWRTIDHYALEDGEFPALTRWTHGNAAFYSPGDDSVYYSARHFSRISRIDFGTGEVVWNMGRDQVSGDTDFGHGLFSFQHAPERQPDGNILLFDNGNLRLPFFSRVIEIALDDPEDPTTGTIVWEYVVHNENFFPVISGFVGDADRLPNGNTLINAGQLTYLYEVTQDGTLVWWLRIGAGFPSNVTYRAERIDALNVDTPGDADGDWDIDLMDLAAAQLAVGRTADGFPERLSDTNGDDVVDAADLAHLAYWMSAPVD